MAFEFAIRDRPAFEPNIREGFETERPTSVSDCQNVLRIHSHPIAALISPISHSFYFSAICEKSVVSNQLTKKFCEIAVVAVSSSLCRRGAFPLLGGRGANP
jgi:hypothetical protein